MKTLQELAMAHFQEIADKVDYMGISTTCGVSAGNDMTYYTSDDKRVHLLSKFNEYRIIARLTFVGFEFIELDILPNFKGFEL